MLEAENWKIALERYDGHPKEFEQQVESTTINAGPTMSFFRHGEDYRPDGAVTKTKSGPQTSPCFDHRFR